MHKSAYQAESLLSAKFMCRWILDLNISSGPYQSSQWSRVQFAPSHSLEAHRFEIQNLHQKIPRLAQLALIWTWSLIDVEIRNPSVHGLLSGQILSLTGMSVQIFNFQFRGLKFECWLSCICSLISLQVCSWDLPYSYTYSVSSNPIMGSR